MKTKYTKTVPAPTVNPVVSAVVANVNLALRKDLIGGAEKASTFGFSYWKKQGKAHGLEASALEDYVKGKLAEQAVLGVNLVQKIAREGASLVRAVETTNKFGDVRTSLAFVNRRERENDFGTSKVSKTARLEAKIAKLEEEKAKLEEEKAKLNAVTVQTELVS